MKKRLLRTMLMALCGGAVALTACVDKDYDLTNLDTTMKVGNGTLMLPTSSTEDIQLNNLFSLTDGGAIVEMPDGTYYLHKGGASAEQSIHIEDIAIPAPDIKPFVATLNGQIAGTTAATKALAPNVSSAEEPDYLWEYPFEEKTTLSYNDANSNEINADIISIDNIKFSNNQKASFTISVSNVGTKLKNLRFGTLRLELPLGFNITSATYNDNHTSILSTTPKIEGNKQVIEFETQPLSLANTKQATIELSLSGAYIGKDGCFSFQPGAVPMKDKGIVDMLKSDIKILGDLHVADEDIDKTALTPAELAQLATGNYSAVLPTSITFSGNGHFHSDKTDNKLHVGYFTGSIHHAIDNIDDIELNNLPEFLTEDDVKLDLSAPQLFLKVTTDLPATATIRGLHMTSYPKNSKGEPTLIDIGDATHPISFTHSENGFVLPLAKNITNIDKPDEYSNCTYGTPIEVPNLEQLLVKVPERMSITGNGADGKLVVELDNCVDLPVNTDYKVQFDYLAHCKLSFGPEFKLVYRTEETGMEFGEDLDDLDLGSLIIEATMKSTIPLDITLEVDPIDKDGNIIEGLAIAKQIRIGATYKDVNPLIIRANADGSQDADKIRLMVKANKGTLNDYLKKSSHQLDGLKLKAELVNNNAGSTESLKATSYIKLTDVRIGLEGGITIHDK